MIFSPLLINPNLPLNNLGSNHMLYITCLIYQLELHYELFQFWWPLGVNEKAEAESLSWFVFKVIPLILTTVSGGQI